MATIITDKVRANAERDMSALADIEPLIAELLDAEPCIVRIHSDDHGFRVYLFPAEPISKLAATALLTKQFPEWDDITPDDPSYAWGEVRTRINNLPLYILMYAKEPT